MTLLKEIHGMVPSNSELAEDELQMKIHKVMNMYGIDEHDHDFIDELSHGISDSVPSHRVKYLSTDDIVSIAKDLDLVKD